MGIGPLDLILILFMIVVAICAGLYFLNRWAGKRMSEQQSLIDKTKQTASIYVIDKSKMKLSEVNMPKVVMEQMPRLYKFMKTPLVKAKVGSQIVTLMCNKDVYEALPLKKTVKVELAGIYIVSMQGLKSKKEFKKSKANAASKPQNNLWSRIRGRS